MAQKDYNNKGIDDVKCIDHTKDDSWNWERPSSAPSPTLLTVIGYAVLAVAVGAGVIALERCSVRKVSYAPRYEVFIDKPSARYLRGAANLSEVYQVSEVMNKK